MHAHIFIGVQATGKSTFFRERFFEDCVRINLDMLRTRHRERLLLDACIAGKTAFVVDGTCPTPLERARYIAPARAAGFRVAGWYFASSLEDAMARNAQRAGDARVPDRGLLGTYKRLVVPTLAEGFDELWYVRMREGGGFTVEPWLETGSGLT